MKGGHILPEYMSKSVAQDMAYRQSMMKYAEKYSVSRASRKYNVHLLLESTLGRHTGVVGLPVPADPHSYPNQRTEAELKLVRDVRRRIPRLDMLELWHRLRQRGYTHRPESLFRVIRKLGLFPTEREGAGLQAKAL